MMNINAETFNSIVNSIIYNYSQFLGLQDQDIYEKMKQFSETFNQKMKQNEESLQFGQDDQTQQESI